MFPCALFLLEELNILEISFIQTTFLLSFIIFLYLTPSLNILLQQDMKMVKNNMNIQRLTKVWPQGKGTRTSIFLLDLGSPYQDKYNQHKINHKMQQTRWSKTRSHLKSFKLGTTMVDLSQIQPNLALNLDLDPLSVREQESNSRKYQNKLKISRSYLLSKHKKLLFLWFFLTLDTFLWDFHNKDTKTNIYGCRNNPNQGFDTIW